MENTAFGQFFLHRRNQRSAAPQPPRSGVAVRLRRVGREPLHHDVRTQPPQDLHRQFDVPVGAAQSERFGVGVVAPAQGRAAQQLELVELDGMDRQLIDDRRLSDEHVVVLARQSEDEMGSGADSPLRRKADGAPRGCEVVPPVHGPQRRIPHRLHAVFDRHMRRPGEFGQVVERPRIDTVGPRADDQPADAGMGESLAEAGAEGFERSIGIGKGLEIGQQQRVGSDMPRSEADAGVDLSGDRQSGRAIRRGERSVVTERTPLVCDFPVAIRAGEAAIDGDFPHGPPERPPGIGRVGVVPSGVTPRIEPLRYIPHSAGS